MPKVSVIIPNFNHGIYLKQRINSVLNQTYQDFEVIILDDCSTDNSKEIIEQFRNHPKVTHIHYNEVNSGHAFYQWNKGVQLAKGELIWIAESDDYCDANLLETLVPLLQQNPDAALAYCKSVRVDEKNRFIDDLSWWYKDIHNSKWAKDYVNCGDD